MALTAFNGSIVSRVSISNVTFGGAIYSANAEQIQVYWAMHGFSTSHSVLRAISMNKVQTAFALSGGANSALSMSAITATFMGSGFVPVGGNLCNGVAC